MQSVSCWLHYIRERGIGFYVSCMYGMAGVHMGELQFAHDTLHVFYQDVLTYLNFIITCSLPESIFIVENLPHVITFIIQNKSIRFLYRFFFAFILISTF